MTVPKHINNLLILKHIYVTSASEQGKLELGRRTDTGGVDSIITATGGLMVNHLQQLLVIWNSTVILN